MVFREQYFAFVLAGRANLLLHPKLFAQPQRHGHDEGTDSSRRIVEVRFQQALEFGQRFVIKSDVVQIFGLDPGFAQAVVNGMGGETMIPFHAREALLLRRGHNLSVAD